MRHVGDQSEPSENTGQIKRLPTRECHRIIAQQPFRQVLLGTHAEWLDGNQYPIADLGSAVRARIAVAELRDKV